MDLALRSRLLVGVPVALWRVVAAGRARRRGGARILMFHGTPRSEAPALERQLRYLRRQFDIVPLEQLAAGTPGALALTFDDGLRSNVAVAYPILRKLGLPATFFVCPGLIEARRWLWNHEVRARLRALGGRAEEVERFVAQMKALDLGTRLAVERRVEAETPDYRPSAEEHEAFDLADWAELSRLDPALVAIGSHTSTHAILASLGPAGAEAEVAGSKRLIEERLGRAVTLFCYPNGIVTPAALALARRHYRLAVTTAPGAVQPGEDPLLLPRLAAPRGLLRTAWSIAPG